MCATTWENLRFVDLISSTWFRHGVGLLKPMCHELYNSKIFAESGEIGWCSTISMMQCIYKRGKFHWRSLVGFAATCLFLGFWEWCVWLLLVLNLWCAWAHVHVDYLWTLRLLLLLLSWLGMLSCLTGCLIFQYTNEMAANIFTRWVIWRCGIDCVWYSYARIFH